MRACRSRAVAVWCLVFAEAFAVPFTTEPAAAAEPNVAPPPSAPAAAPVPVAPGTSPAAPPASPAAAPERLPSYFMVEVGPSGELYADGSALGSAAELEPRARGAATNGVFVGAVLFIDVRAGGAAAEVTAVLRRAGFSTLMEARRSAPPELSVLVRAERERARQARQRLIAAGVIEGDPAASRAAPQPAERERPRPPAVELQTVGLYLAGPANTEPTRRQLVKQFERNFPAFRRCHADAGEHSENLSFGVDLLVPKEGGRAKVRQTRTRLTGNAFKACMERVLEGMRFDPLPSARPEVVSYSVLFRPEKR